MELQGRNTDIMILQTRLQNLLMARQIELGILCLPNSFLLILRILRLDSRLLMPISSCRIIDLSSQVRNETQSSCVKRMKD